MGHIVGHDVTFLDHRDAVVWLAILTLLAHALSVVLLGLNDVPSQHLGVLNLNLRIVKNVVVVINVLYYFDGLVLVLLFRL